MKKALFLLSCLLLLSSTRVWAQTTPEVVVVRVVEDTNKVRISIARGTAEPEFIEFDGGYSEKRTSRVAADYQRVFAKLYAEGYVLQGTISGGGPANLGRSMLFVKAPKS